MRRSGQEGVAVRRVFRKPPTADQAVLEELRTRLVLGELQPGQQLRQDVLAASMDVSRVPVREALRTLAAEGQAVHLPQRGYFVADLDLAELEETYRIRELLENEALRVAVPRLGPAEIAQIECATEEMRAAAVPLDLVRLSEANRVFHFTMFEASGLLRLTDLIRMQWGTTDSYRSRYFTEERHRTTVDGEHAEILVALRAGDVDEVVRLHDVHRRHTVQALRSILPPARPRRQGR